MAVFEKRKSMKVDLDDTIPLTCVIEAAQNVQTHIVSKLTVFILFRMSYPVIARIFTTLQEKGERFQSCNA